MPLYDYQCEHCQTIFEVCASFREKEVGLKPVCPKCQSTETRQILTVGVFMRSSGGQGGSLPSTSCGPNGGQGCCSL